LLSSSAQLERENAVLEAENQLLELENQQLLNMVPRPQHVGRLMRLQLAKQRVGQEEIGKRFIEARKSVGR